MFLQLSGFLLLFRTKTTHSRQLHFVRHFLALLTKVALGEGLIFNTKRVVKGKRTPLSHPIISYHDLLYWPCHFCHHITPNLAAWEDGKEMGSQLCVPFRCGAVSQRKKAYERQQKITSFVALRCAEL